MSTKADEMAIDLLTQYRDFIEREVKADDLEKHPYVPQIEQCIEELSATPALTGSQMERVSLEKAKRMIADYRNKEGRKRGDRADGIYQACMVIMESLHKLVADQPAACAAAKRKS